jgi:hypothetical protein
LSCAATFVVGVAPSCVAHSHVVGLGAAGSNTVVDRQYYWIFGLYQVNDVDARRMSGDLTSYTIETRFGWVDLLLLPLLLPLTATSRTVVVRT